MLKERDEIIRKALVLVDALAVTAAFAGSYLLRRRVGPDFLAGVLPRGLSGVIEAGDVRLDSTLVMFFIGLPAWLLMLRWAGVYRAMRLRRYPQLLAMLLRAGLAVSLILGTVLFLSKARFVSRLFFIFFAASSLLVLAAEKSLVYAAMHFLRRRGLNSRRLLLVGTGPRAAGFAARLRHHPQWGLEIRGVIDDQPGRGVTRVEGIPVVGGLGDIPAALHADPVDEVVFVVPRSRLSACEFALKDCETEGIPANVALDLFDMKLARPSITELEGVPLLRFDTRVAGEGPLLVKRMMDVVLSGLGLVLLSPLLLGTALAIRLTSPGPALFRQERLGLHGRRFVLYKFRTMRSGAHDELSRVDSVAEMDTPEFRRRKTAWMTPLGRVLRKLSIDELPQLVNVFAGQMSLIGPRPTVPDEAQKYETWQRRRFSMKPGITCLWQVMGRNKIGFEDWMRLDLEYLDRWSLWLDVKILLRTIPTVLFGIGAY